MPMTPARCDRRWPGAILLAVALAGAVGAVGAQQMMPAMRTEQKPTVIDAALALWAKGEYGAAVAEFEKVIADGAENLALHERFARSVAGARWRATEYEQERGRAEAARGKAAAPAKTDAELSAMKESADAAVQALTDLIVRYERWMKERPKSAVYPYGLALLIDPKDEARREKLLLEAAALDPKLVEPYTQLVALHAGYDDEAALKYVGKALELKPGDLQSQLNYARTLWAVDQPAARRYYEGLLARHAGAKDGAAIIQQFIGAVEDPSEKASLTERYRREYPDQWTPGYYGNVGLFGTLVSVDPPKGLGFALEMRAALEKEKPGPDGKLSPSTAYARGVWVQAVDYAQAVVDARALIAGGNGAAAVARLEKTKRMSAVDDTAQLDVLRAEAAAATGDAAKAYNMLVASLAADITESAQRAILSIGATLGKSPRQVDDDVWTRRMATAETFESFELEKLGSKDRVKLADLRGKVVLVDFWFPG